MIEEALLKRQGKLLPAGHEALLANVDKYERLLSKTHEKTGRARVVRWRIALLAGGGSRDCEAFRP